MSKQWSVVGVLVVGGVLGSTGGAVPAVAGQGTPERLPSSCTTCASLAIGVPFYNVGAVNDAGAVNVLYGGTDAGLSGDGSQLWDQTTLVFDGPEEDDYFGQAVAAGDFSGDGFPDLAIGVPGEGVGSVAAAGMVHIVLGSASGLTATGSQTWHQDVSGILETAEEGDRFGLALAAGDFNGDGHADLAIGVPSEDLGSPDPVNAGVVQVLFGSPSGLAIGGDQLWSQNSAGIQGGAEADDQFGLDLATGDFNGDGYADLAIGVPFEDFEETNDGVVHVLYGSAADGLTATGSQLWSQSDLGAVGGYWDNFGHALAAGDFDHDGYDDLAVGAPYRGVGGADQAGAAYVIFGSAAGLTATGSQTWSQNTSGIGGMAEEGDHFGMALAAGDLDDDHYDDLAIGVPREDLVSGQENEGCVHALYGSPSGLTASGSELWHQDSTDVVDVAESYDKFGSALAIGDFDGDGYADLAIGVPGEYNNPGTYGAVSVLYGTWLGLNVTGNQIWYQGAAGVPGIGGGDFGYSLAALPPPRAGIFADGFESGLTWSWSTTVP